MIPFDQAIRIVMDAAHRLSTEQVPLRHALHRILAEDVAADSDLPPFRKSAMDGYACRKTDLTGQLRVVDTIQAGATPTRPVGPGECARIMTGAMVPDGADCVVMVEYSEESNGLVRFTVHNSRANICMQGEDLKKGDVMIRAGERLLPQHIAVLATAGCAEPLVSVKPRVGVIATGDELVEPDVTPGPSQIRNSNSHQLCAQILAIGAEPDYHGIAQDTDESIGGMIRLAMSRNNVLLVSGGVSAGDFDLVPDILRKNGFELLFEKIATKPGMPTVFGVAGNTFCFGLPGNPVSTFVLFELLVKPFLYAMMGHNFQPPVVSLRLARDVTRKTIDRDSWIPVRKVGHAEVEPVEYHGSGHLTALPMADGLICIPRGVTGVAAGEMVDVRQI